MSYPADMLPRGYTGQNCSIARTLELVGDRWTLLIVRDVFLGRRRFDELSESLGVATNVLTDRLNRLVADGILRREPQGERPDRFEYRLTEKGRELNVVLLALMQWGDRHISPKPPRIARRRDDHSRVSVALVDRKGRKVEPRDVEVVAGPGT
jgi:DNA-binding HxlR family transcriptional regulator